MGLRITTWNVNGIKNPFGYQPWRENRTFQAMFDKLQADIVVMQETKIQRKDLTDDMVLVPGWDAYFSLPKYKKGYSGVAIYTRSSKCCPIRAEEGITGVLCPPNSSTKFRELPTDQQIGGYPTQDQLSGSIDEPTLDSEGRCVILEFPAFVLIGVYSPATRDDTRVEFRQGFIDAMDVRVRNLVAMGKQVVLCGDLNIIRSELDTAGIQDRLRKEAMTLDDFISTPSRRFFNQFVFGGRVVGDRDQGREEPVMWDICREFHPERLGMYTCWETRKNARPGNYGSRIDYVLCSSGIKDWFIDSNIQEGLLGSDHCPVYATLTDTVKSNGAEVHITDIMNPKGMVENGQRLRDWSAKDLLPASAKLIPEFDRRQSIRDMFSKKPALSTKTGSATPGADGLDSPSYTNSGSSTPNPSASFQDPPIRASQASVTSSMSVPPEKPPSSKRQIAPPPSSSRPQKKSKPTLAKENSGTGFSQRSLMGFFKQATPTPGPDNSTDGDFSPQRTSAPVPAAATEEKNSPLKKNKSVGFAGDDIEDDWPASSTKTSSPPQTKFIDPIESKESWAKLLGKRIVPKCEHGDDCQTLTTKKAGINCGRSFFMCARPLGPSGDKEQGTAFRCKTFIWSSDWSGRQPQ
ncbi:Endonuclease/exonuclease/phosphatase [Podospora appendiculata]|uniref:DNA-(apurinic or apyrimidinic site) endonuclease 2 n=1 Tax=Podospora appendiculata TaxID=314037 RepID=A0AAE1CI58_9PEZI|nr:Endonuclease/exonuclease/phosphatase [Podospora appendiculata]